MFLHSKPSAVVGRYVEWFHRKFRSPYTLAQWPMIKKDHESILSLVEMYDLRTFMEIGTWKGYTSLLVYLFPQVERVKCIDIHDEMEVEFRDVYHSILPKDEVGDYFRNTFIDLIFADTMKYQKGMEQHDLIFIDGNHNYEHVKNDTELALSMNPKFVIWHDYNSVGNEDVTKYINELEKNGSRIACFEGSLCVAALADDIKI